MTVPVLVTLLVAIGILSFCSALFSRVETALFLLKPHQLRRLEENHPSITNFIQLFRENPRRVLNVLLLGDGLVNVLLIVLCLFFLWEGPLAGRVPQWLAAILIFAMVVLLCDLVPKLVALAAPSSAARLWGAGQRATALVAWAVWLMTFIFAVTAGLGFSSMNIADVKLARASRPTWSPSPAPRT